MRILLLSLTFLCALQSGFAQTAKQFYDKATEAKDVNEQIKLYTQAIDKSPKYISALHRRGDAYRQTGKLKAAINDYSKIIDLSPEDPFKYYARALAYADQNNYQPAIEDLTEAIKLKGDYDSFYFQRAQAYFETAKYALSMKDLAKIKKKNDDTALLEGKNSFFMYNYSKAKEKFNYLLDKNPDNTEALFYMGRIEFNNEAYDEAISFFSKVINRTPRHEGAYRLRASAFKEIGDYPAAVEDYSALLEFKPDFNFYNRRGLVYEALEQWQNAAGDYNKSIELNPKWAIAYNNRGYAYLKLKEYKKAKSDFETAIKLSPSLPTPYVNLAGYYWYVKKDKKNMYKALDSALKYNFKDFDSLYDNAKKGWMFKNISNTVEFRSFMADYTK